MKRVLEAGVVDRIWINEDMAYKNHSMISPDMTREFLMPSWKRWIEESRQKGVLIFDMDSDGYIENLIPVWLEAGFNVCDPIEVAAGNDINKFRKMFGSNMAYRMGVDKRCIAKGGEAIRHELQRLEPVIKTGGFIPGCDHGVPPDVSWNDFVNYSEILAQMTGWIK
jgi:uroporphyrinogen decarboxylase